MVAKDVCETRHASLKAALCLQILTDPQILRRETSAKPNYIQGKIHNPYWKAHCVTDLEPYSY